MEISTILRPEGVFADFKATSKKQLLQEIARHAHALTNLPERQIFEILLERERLGTTGVGQGIAIPHGKLPELDTLHGMFVRLGDPIDFDAIDDRSVDLIFVLLAPETAGADHLKALARVSRLLRDKAMCAKLRGAEDRDALYALLIEPAAAANDAA